MKRSVSILSWVFFIFSLLIFSYEFFIVKNPFFDPIPAYFIWGLCVIMSGLWIFRLRGAKPK